MKSACIKIKKRFACTATVVGSGLSMKARKKDRVVKKKEKFQKREEEFQKRKLKRNGIKVDDDDDSEEDKTKDTEKQQPQKKQENEMIEAQGNISNNLPEFICKEFNVSIENIIVKK